MAIYSAKRAARILGVNASRVRQFILAGRLRATKAAGAWIIQDRDLARFRALRRRIGRPPSK